MHAIPRRAAWFRQTFTFAALAFQAANLAHSATATPNLTYTPASIDFRYQTGAALPAAQTVQVKSSGAALSFTIPPVEAQWLSVSVNSGTTPASIKIYVNPTSLPSGAYRTTITFNAPSAATTSQDFVVTLEVSDPPPVLTVGPTTLAFTYATDQALLPAAKPIVLTSTGGAVSTAITVTGGTWLSASPSGSISIVGIPATVMVNVNPAGLVPGTYSGSIKFTPSITAIAPITVNVSFQVSAGVPVVTGLWPCGMLINSPNTYVTVRGQYFFSTSTASIGNTKLANPIVISSTAMLVVIPASLMAATGALPITVTTPTAASPSATTQNSTFQVYLPGPRVLAVTDAASYAVGSISPGEVIAIYGIGLGPNTLVAMSGTDPVDTSLPTSGSAVTTVTVDGVAAPLLYTSPSQVGFIVPFSVAQKRGSKVDVLVTYNSIAAAQATKVNVVDAQPGLFTMDLSGEGQGAILNYSTTGQYSLNSGTNPAIKGTTTAVLYLTGYGLTACTDIPATDTTPASACKTNATEANLISGAVSPVLPVSVTIDGQPAPGAVAQAPLGSVAGLMQVFVPVPASAKSGNVPVVVTLGTAPAQFSSQAKVTLAVK